MVGEWDIYGNFTHSSRLIHISEDTNFVFNQFTHMFCVDHQNVKIVHMDYAKRNRIFISEDPYGYSKLKTNVDPDLLLPIP